MGYIDATVTPPRSPWSSPPQRLLYGAMLLVLVAGYAFFVYRRIPTTFDDAYMFERYARNIVDGYGIAWNRGEGAAFGTTSLLYLASVALVRVVAPGPDAGALLPIISATFGLLAVLAMGRATTFFRSDALRSLPSAALTVFLLALAVLNRGFLYHATSGMDTTLSILTNALLILAVLQWIERRTSRTLTLTLVAAYTTYLARPDNLLFAVAFPVLAIWVLGMGPRRRAGVAYVGALSAVLAVDLAMRAWAFGDPFPLPMYAKRMNFYAGYLGHHKWNAGGYLFDIARAAAPFLALSVLTLTRVTARIAAAFLLPVLVVFAGLFAAVQIMGYEARLYYPSLPFIVVGSLLMLDRFLLARDGRMPVRGSDRDLLRVALALVTIAAATSDQLRGWSESAYRRVRAVQPHSVAATVACGTPVAMPPALGWWQVNATIAGMAARLPAGTRLVASEHGRVGASALQVHIIDPLGLHDRWFAHHGFSAEELFRREPDLIWFPHPDYSSMVDAIRASPAFREAYDDYPGAFDYGLAIRKTSSPEIRSAVEDAWRDAYGARPMADFLAPPCAG